MVVYNNNNNDINNNNKTINNKFSYKHPIFYQFETANMFQSEFTIKQWQ